MQTPSQGAKRSWGLPWAQLRTQTGKTGALARESRDTLFLLAIIGWIVLMQAAHMPWATTAFCAAVLAWRAWLTVRQKPAPSRWLVIGLLLLALALTASQFRTIVGREAGSALILLLLTLKTLEIKARRDAFVIFFLGFFTLLSHFLFSQSLLTAAGIVVGVLALLTALVNTHMPAGYPSLRQAFLIALRMAALGTPIMLALFMLFPRFAPLWGLPANDRAKTGLSNDMTVGNIAELAQDDSIAFRVRFDGPLPPRQDLYFRGPVLGRLEGQKWVGSDFPMMPRADNKQAATAPAAPSRQVSYEVLLQPHHLQWLLTLDVAVERPTLPAGWRALQMRSLEWVSQRPVVDVLRYRARSQLGYRSDADLPAAYLRPYLALPPGLNPRTRELARQLLDEPALANSSPEQKIAAVLQRLRTGGYSYTLAPGLTGEHAADVFWFDSKQGFCEHIANAFVVLMRNMQIPARIVTGYQGGELNPVDGMLSVRQSDAHAWAEVWLPQKGWVRIDPTASVSPSRVEDFARLQARGAVGDAINTINPEFASVLQRGLQGMRNFWDATNTRWNNWVLNYTQDRQLDLLRQLGFANISWTTLAQLLGAALAGMAAIVALWAWLARQRQDPWLHLLQQARKRLLGMGLQLPDDMAASAALTPRQLRSLLLQQQGGASAHAPVANASTPAHTNQADHAAWAAWGQWLLALEALRYAPAADTNATSSYTPNKALKALKTQLRRLPRLPVQQAKTPGKNSA